MKAVLAGLAMTLSGCSYHYLVSASGSHGRVVFSVETAPLQSPACLRQILVTAVEAREPVWEQKISYDQPCANRFPVTYGEPLLGTPLLDAPAEPAMPLQPGVTYEVLTTTGATGYGSGRFTVMQDGTVRNLE
ncbi:MAG: hypothetical protein AB7F98_07705 [Novosphingobium sp.]